MQHIRDQFPILSRKVTNGKPLVYFDNAASKQKPQIVLDAMQDCYTRYYANVHRGAHTLSAESTDAFEEARRKIAKFINAKHEYEVIFTKGTTESINLVAASFGRSHLKTGDVVLSSFAEHHSNIVPWQILREQVAINLKPLPLTKDGTLDLEQYELILQSECVKLVTLNHASNALGVINDAARLIALAHQYGARILLDGCQAMAHLPVDVQELDVDFYAFSGHKIYGPSGIGVLYGKEALLDAMPPYQGGGEMIDRVTFERTTWAHLPNKFEAGTPAIAETIGLGAAIDFLTSLDRKEAHAQEQALLTQAMQGLNALGGITLYGQAPEKLSIISFNLGALHHNDVATIVNNEGVALRAGHHCAQPLMDYYGISGTVRASFCAYNTAEEVDIFLTALKTVQEIFA